MIELVFVIVVLGILAAVAVPKFAATRLDAQIAKGRSDISAIRSAIVSERQTRLIRGDSDWITKLHSSPTSFFDNNGTASSSLLMYGVATEAADGHWHNATGPDGNGQYTYSYMLEANDNVFTYNPTAATVLTVPSGGFVCTAGTRCADLTN